MTVVSGGASAGVEALNCGFTNATWNGTGNNTNPVDPAVPNYRDGANYDLQPLTGSNLIGAGAVPVNATLDRKGAAFDVSTPTIGAYEA